MWPNTGAHQQGIYGWGDPSLDGPKGVHSGFLQNGQDTNFHISFLMPGGLPFWVESFHVQKSAPGDGVNDRIITHFKIGYISAETGLYEDYQNGEYIATGQILDDLKERIRVIDLISFKATKVTIHFQGAIVKNGVQTYETFIQGRFDIGVKKAYTFSKQIKQIRAHCKQKENDGSLTLDFTQSGSITSIEAELIESEHKFVCGYQTQRIISTDSVNRGIYGFNLTFCQISCKEKIVPKVLSQQILAQTILALDDSTLTLSITDYLETLNLYSCPLLSCQTHLVEDESSTSPGEIYVSGMTDIVINKAVEFDRNIVLKCENRAGIVSSQQFQVKVTCQTQQIELPDDFQDQQAYDATTDATLKAKFVFSQFKTQFSVCPMKEYKIYLRSAVKTVPYGIDVTNPITVGSQTSFEVPVVDWQNPSVFNFIIQGCDFQGNCLTTHELMLQVTCPNPIAFYLVPSQYLLTLYTFVGAEGSQGRYTFPASVSTLPRCNDIQSYQIIDVSPPGGITYPSESCSTDPCLIIDLDVRTEGSITFKVKPVDSQGQLPSSDMITVSVSKDALSPEVINFNQGQDKDQHFAIHQDSMFSFNPFQCTTGCTITNYQVLESETSLSPVSGLGQPTYNSVNGKMEISVDTSSLKTYSFVVKAEVENIPTIFAISNQLSATVQCGSEIISVSQSQVLLEPFEKASTIFSYTDFRTFFSSSVSECGLMTFELFTSSSLVTPWSDSSISLDDSQNLLINQNIPQNSKVFIKGSSSSGAHEVLEVQIIVCGNEEITSLSADKKYFFGSQVQEITFQEYFETSYSQANSDYKCSQIKSYSIVQCEASDDTSKFTISDQKIVIQTSIPFKQNLCVQAQTFGQKTAIHIQEIEIDFCGLEEISLEGGSKTITKIFPLDKKIYEIDYKQEGYSFTSSKPNCPVTKFRILNKDLSVYSGSILELNSYIIKVSTLSPLQKVYYLEASSDEGKTNTELKLDLTICGFEKIKALQSQAKELKISAQLSSYILSNDIEKLFELEGNSLCPIAEYKTFGANDSVLKIEDNKLRIYPKKAQKIQFNISLQAKSLGSQTAYYSYSITLDQAILEQLENQQQTTVVESSKNLKFSSLQELLSKNLQYYVKFSIFDCDNNSDPQLLLESSIIAIKVTSKYVGQDSLEKELFNEINEHFDCDLPQEVRTAILYDDPNKPGEKLREVRCFFSGKVLDELVVKRTRLNKFVPTTEYLIKIFKNDVFYQVQIYLDQLVTCDSIPGIEKIQDQKNQQNNKYQEEKQKDLINLKQIDALYSKIQSQTNILNKTIAQQQDLKQIQSFSKPTIRSVKLKQETENNLMLIINFSNEIKEIQGQLTCNFFNITIFQQYKLKTIQGSCHNESSRSLSSTNESFQIKFVDSDAKTIYFRLMIQNSSAISEPNPYQIRDLIQVQMLPNNLLVDKNNSTFQFEIIKEALIPPMIQDDLFNKMVETACKTLFTIGAGALVQGILKSGSTQQVWGLIKSSQIVIHMMLLKFSTTAPDNIINYNSFLSGMVQHDMYPMDNINEKVFKFTETESPIELFENLGYEGKNFIMLTGSMIINIFTIFGMGLAGYIAKTFTKRFSRYFYVRQLGIMIDNALKDPVSQVLSYYLASFMEIFFSVILSLLEPEYYSWSDRFSMVTCILSSFILIILPIFIGIAIQKQLVEYTFMYEEFSQAHWLSANFNLVIIVRKALFVLILILAHDYGSLQIILHMIFTMAFACILFQIKPYLDKSSQNQNTANEIIIWISSLILQVLANTDYNRMYLGMAYVVISSSNMVYSLYCMIEDVVKKTIPISWAKYKRYREDAKYKEWIQKRWLKKKEEKAKENPEEEVAQKVWEHAKLIVKIKESREKLEKLENVKKAHLEWLISNQLDINVLWDQKKEILALRKEIAADEEQCENENNDFGIIMGNSFGGVRQLKFSENTVGRRSYTFPHMKGEPPNSEDLLTTNVIEPYLVENKISALNQFDIIQQQALQEKVTAYNTDILQQFLQIINLRTVEIIGDGNCAPRAIAAAIYGNQEEHSRVRREVCQYLNVNHMYWGKQSCQKHYDRYIVHTLSQDGSWFSDTELKAAAKLYNRAIIIFSCSYPTPYFDLVQLAMTDEGNRLEPIYLHHVNGNHFNLLTSQKEVSLQNLVDIKIKRKFKLKKTKEQSQKLETIKEE